MKPSVIGLDIGGANLKAALASGEARSRSFELWKHPECLAEVLRGLLDGWESAQLAVTMTGELCDCFPTKRDGVRHILAEVERAFPATPLRVWTTDGKFVTADEAKRDSVRAAASNWHALATFAGWCLVPKGSAILLDVGSTTTDIIPIDNGLPTPIGRTDPERLKSKELVYTGVRRTPVCALIQEGMAAELFATTLDVYLRLGLIPGDPDDCQTADGRPATSDYAHARLTRMLGGDPESISAAETHRLALTAYEKQRSLIVNALRNIAARLTSPPRTVVLFGSGEFLARVSWIDFAVGFDRDTFEPTRIISLSEQLGAAASVAACAYAVAVLAEKV